MTDKKTGFAEDKTERERRKNLSDEEIKDLELAGGVEGGMQAGNAGGPTAGGGRKKSSKEQGERGD